MHAQSALAGDRVFFRRLEAFRAARSKAYTREIKLAHVRSAADEAWRSRNLRQLIASYTSIENDLTESERAKLAYARKHDREDSS